MQLPNQKFSEQLTLIKDNLEDLAEIQIEEGKRELFESQRAIASVDLFTHLEIYALILIAIVIQVVVMYNPKTTWDWGGTWSYSYYLPNLTGLGT